MVKIGRIIKAYCCHQFEGISVINKLFYKKYFIYSLLHKDVERWFGIILRYVRHLSPRKVKGFIIPNMA